VSAARRVLLVDDSEDLRLLLRLTLASWGGYEVVGEAGDGELAVRLAEDQQPDLVMLDLAMPRMDGLQALPLIRAAAHDARVIVLSGFDQGQMAAKATAAGADGYIEKGVPMEELARVVDEVLAGDRS
jgi:two-component system, chemotaxis family, chemotaxis protein CheY